MSLSRRALLAALSLAPWLGARGAAAGAEPWTQRALAFPADFGAHPAQRIEWWYVTGALDVAGGASASSKAKPLSLRTAVR